MKNKMQNKSKERKEGKGCSCEANNYEEKDCGTSRRSK